MNSKVISVEAFSISPTNGRGRAGSVLHLPNQPRYAYEVHFDFSVIFIFDFQLHIILTMAELITTVAILTPKPGRQGKVRMPLILTDIHETD